jgi:hypothetical protein
VLGGMVQAVLPFRPEAVFLQPFAEQGHKFPAAGVGFFGERGDGGGAAGVGSIPADTNSL